MFEGLLDKRNFFNSTTIPDNFDSTDDEFEPIAKIPKIDENINFSSSKPDNNNEVGARDIPSDIDADSEDSPDEMECIALKGSDCVDSKTVPIISPKISNNYIEETENSFNTPKVVRRSKDISKFNRSNRKSKNCAIFYYKHVDTDNDQVTNNENEQNLASETSEEEIWEYANQSPQVMENQEETMIKSNQKEPESLYDDDDDDADLKTNSVQQENIVSNTPQLITKEALRELVLEAESLVLQKMSEKTTKKEYFLNEVLAKTNVRKNLHKKVMEKNQKDTAKISRVQEWLKHNHNSTEVKNGQSLTLQLTDCEASYEYTSCSDSSEEITDSVATCLQGIDQLQTSTEGLENFSPVHKVKMRAKTSDNRRHSDRPWSVSCISQLTRNTRQSFSDAKVAETTNVLANFSISESALNKLQKDRTTSESDSKNCNNKNAVNSVGSKNSLKKRKTKLRKKSLSSNKKSDSGSEIHANIIKTMSKSDSFNMTLMEDLSTAISMMSFMKDNNSNNSEQVAQKPPTESEDEQVIKTPDFKIGSITSVYGNPYSMNLGSLAALANYNSENCETTEIPTENLSSISEHNMWDNYMEKYNSEAYSEDRDIDGARKLLDFGDDYRNFIDSQSDCCSSLSCANQMDSLSPPRHCKNISNNISLPSSNDNSMKALRQQRIQELPETERHKDRSSNSFLEKMRQKSNEYEFTNTTKCKSSQQSLLQSLKPDNISSSEDEETKENKLIAECEKKLEQTQKFQNANSQLLRPEDYDEIIETCLINIQRLENVSKRDNDLNQMKVNALIASWNRLLNWSENAAGIRRLQQEIAEQKQLLDSMEINDELVLNSEEAIRDKIQELNSTLGELHKHRSNMLKLNASVHSYVSKETNKQNILRSDINLDNTQSSQYDVDTLADEELHKQLKDEIVSLYAKWDSVNLILTSKLENLKHSLVCWKQIENGLEELKLNLSKDRGALNGLKGAIEEGSSSPEELVDNVQQISKLLSEKLENRIQTISTNEDFMLHPEAALKFIANTSSNPSYQSDSGISDGGFSELSERERRLIALKKIAKQLESALSPSSEVLKTITQRMEAAENELKVLQNTCRELILRTSTELLKQQGLDVSSHSQSQINVQIPIITIKPTTKSKRSTSRRNKERNRSLYTERRSDKKVEPKVSSNDTTSESDPDEPKTTQWKILKRVAKLAMPFQLTVVTLFCIAWFLEPRCCDTLNNLSMSLTPQLRYINGPPPT
ncbi:klarsicht protein isoform X2 [Chironomus tepperi]